MVNAPKDQNNVPWPNGRFARSLVVDESGARANLKIDHVTGYLLAKIVTPTGSGTYTSENAKIDENNVTSMVGENPDGGPQAVLAEHATGYLLASFNSDLGSAILTESGEFLTTENGLDLITE